MSRTTVLNRPHDAGTADAPRDVLSLVETVEDAPREGISLVSPATTADAPVALGIPVVRTPMTPEELQAASWQERALCSQTDPEAFFPEKGGSTREAKRVCLGCDVRSECLEYALTHDERFGIWGGLSERERRRVKREAV